MVERLPGETRRAFSARVDYLALGPGRALSILAACSTGGGPGVPLNTLKKWCRRWEWVRLSESYDRDIANKILADYEARRLSILGSGLALDFERVDYLYKLHAELDGMRAKGAGIIRDKKIVGDEVVITERLNNRLYESLRGVLDDIASEVGGRVRRAEVNGVGVVPVVNLALLDIQDLIDLENITRKAGG